MTDPSSTGTPVSYFADSGVAKITLNRPGKRNALSAEMIAALSGALAISAKDPKVRIVLVAGAGRDFCAGADLAELDQSADAGVLDHMATARNLADVYLAMRNHPRPVVAAVHGRALGGGCGVATACDIVLAAESAQFGYPEVNIGFIPAIVMTMLRRSVSEKRAFELLTMGDPVSANEAKDLGLINRVYPDAEFDARVEAFVQKLATRSSSAVSLTKDLLYRTDGVSFESAIDAGVHANAIARMTEDARKGIARFVKKT